MKRNKLIVLALILTLSAVMSCSCSEAGSSGADADKPKVTLWATGSDNIRALFEKAIEVYNSKPESKSIVELQFIMQGSGDQGLSDRLAAAKLAGRKDTDFDLIAENGSSLAGYIDKAGDDLFVPLDFSKIPNYENVLIKSGFYTECVVPYRGTTVVMAYDSERVPDPPKTFEELDEWIKANPGRFAYNSPGTGGREALLLTGPFTGNLPLEAYTLPMKNG